jgi:hypothetical protein
VQLAKPSYLASSTLLLEANVELVIEQGFIVGANVNGDGEALQDNHLSPANNISMLRFCFFSFNKRSLYCECYVPLTGERLRGQCTETACQQEFPCPADKIVQTNPFFFCFAASKTGGNSVS